MHLGVTSYLGGVMAYHGLEEQYSRIDAVWNQGRHDAAIDLVTDEMVDVFGLAGTPGDVMAKIADYEGAVDRVMLASPGFTRGGDEVLANYRAIIEMLAN